MSVVIHNLEDIEKRLKEIEKVAGDDERAHCMEKDLWNDFILFVSTDDNTPIQTKRMARKVLSSKMIEFSRWFA